MTWLSSPISEIAVPSATSAEASGIAIANREPNTRNSTIPAVMMPRPVPPTEGWFACCAIWPETAIDDAVAGGRRRGLDELLRVRDREVLAPAGRRVTVANATVPSGVDLRAAPCRTVRLTRPREATVATLRASHRRLLDVGVGDLCSTVRADDDLLGVAPPVGAAAWNRSSACVDSVFGRLKSFEYSVPTALFRTRTRSVRSARRRRRSSGGGRTMRRVNASCFWLLVRGPTSLPSP